MIHACILGSLPALGYKPAGFYQAIMQFLQGKNPQLHIGHATVNDTHHEKNGTPKTTKGEPHHDHDLRPISTALDASKPTTNAP